MNVEWEHPVLPDESWLKSENVRVGSWRYLKLSAVCVTGVLTSDDDAHAVHSVQLVTHNPFGCPSNFGSGHSPYYLISWNKKTWLVEVGTLRGTVSPIPRTDRRKRYPCDGGKLATAMHRNALWSAKFHRSFLGFWVSWFGEETFGKSAKYTGQKFAGSPGGAKSWIPHKPNRSQLGGAPTQWPLGPRPMQNVGFLWPCISVCAVNNNSMKKLISLKLPLCMRLICLRLISTQFIPIKLISTKVIPIKLYSTKRISARQTIRGYLILQCHGQNLGRLPY